MVGDGVVYWGRNFPGGREDEQIFGWLGGNLYKCTSNSEQKITRFQKVETKTKKRETIQKLAPIKKKENVKFLFDFTDALLVIIIFHRNFL